MTDFHIAEVAFAGERPGAIRTAFDGIEAISTEYQLAHSGDLDFVERASDLVVGYQSTPSLDRLTVVAIRGPEPSDAPRGRFGLRLIDADTTLAADDVIAYSLPDWPLKEDLENLTVGSITVRAAERGRGVGRAVHDALVDVARQLERTRLQGWTDGGPEAGPDGIRPTHGEFAVPRDQAARFALALGYRLAQAERHSVQDVSAVGDLEMIDLDGYELTTYHDATPERFLDSVAALQEAMSSDAPVGDFVRDAQRWDADRVREFDADVLKTRTAVTTIATRTDGTPAGFTQLMRGAEQQWVDQWNTVVLSSERGHGLGRALKIKNLAAARERWPEIERIHTWNAAENDHMWAINEALGYRVRSIEGGWQLDLGA